MDSDLKIERALEQHAPDEHAAYAVLRTRFTAAQSHWCAGFPFGNDHGRGHIERVLERLDQILSPGAAVVPLDTRTPREDAITTTELFLTMIAILGHDLGTARDRRDHNVTSAEIMRALAEQNPLLFRQDHSALLAGAIECHSSSTDIDNVLFSKYALREHEQFGNGIARPRVVAALVRLADELDEDTRRAEPWVQKIVNVPKESHPYWEFCQRVQGIRVQESRSIEFQINLIAEDLQRLVHDPERGSVSFAWFLGRKLHKISREIGIVNRHLPSSLRVTGLATSVRVPGKQNGPITLREAPADFHRINSALFLDHVLKEQRAVHEMFRTGAYADVIAILSRHLEFASEVPAEQRLCAHYDLACAHALSSDRENAVRFMTEWLVNGDNGDWELAGRDAINEIFKAKRDPDLASILPDVSARMDAILARRDRRDDRGGSSCVAAETMIRVPAGEEPIGTLVAGDHVVAYDPVHRETKVVRIAEVRIGTSRVWRTINRRLRVTSEHLILLTDGSFARAGDLPLGAQLVGDGGSMQVESNEFDETQATAYDLVLESDPHTYFADGVVCHNKYPLHLLLDKEMKKLW